MKRFAELYATLDATTRTNEKIAALTAYFQQAPPADAAWALFFLTGRRPRSPINRTKLRTWAAQAADVPDWLFEECYDAVGDLAETMALLVPGGQALQDLGLAEWIEQRLLPLATMDEISQREALLRYWSEIRPSERFILNKLLTGSFRVGVSQELVLRGLGAALNVAPARLAHQTMGPWEPTAEFFGALAISEAGNRDLSRPYPFCLAHALEEGPESLGSPTDWLAEWKWDGIRAQLIRRDGNTYLWSRGEELIHGAFPEIVLIGNGLPDGTVLDGEILAWRDGAPLTFQDLQRRLGRKSIGKKLSEEVPVALIAFDLLEHQGEDWRSRPLRERRPALEQVLQGASRKNLLVSEALIPDDWEDLRQRRSGSRQMRAEGLMLKALDSPYGVGRKRGTWWKWKVEPFSVDAVLIYAQRGSGKRASLYTDYTFGVWSEGILVPFAKAYSGLTDAEIAKVDAFIRRNTLEKFGPVRTVKPELVFEIAFEGIQLSTRHKSGVAVRFPRILRQRLDKSPEQADQLEQVKALLKLRESTEPDTEDR